MKFIDIHTHQNDSTNNCISIFQDLDYNFLNQTEQFISIGLHPWHIKENNNYHDVDKIKKNSFNKMVLAIGECGLDLTIDITLTKQIELFKIQIEIAENCKKPLIIHCVKAFNELIKIKKEMKTNVPIIIHGYNSNSEITAQLIKNNFYFSFGKAVLTEKSNAAKNISTIPLSRIFFETDTTTNKINEMYEMGAMYLKLNIKSLQHTVYNTFKNIFKYE